MTNHWVDRLVTTVADRGRDLLGLRSEPKGPRDLADLCAELLRGRGEASGLALAREILRGYGCLDDEAKREFFGLLYNEFNPDPEQVRLASERYFETRNAEDLIALFQVVEPPRQELLRQLNMAPGGTRRLVGMRSDLLEMLPDCPGLAPVDADFRHLLASWFNRGFLQLRRIDWHTPADILEKLIRYEAVHAIQGWDDLRRRLANDRRCFAFFHPSLPDEPLIFVVIALVNEMSPRARPLLDPGAPIGDAAEADTALFYSINNTQRGLRGISFGNFLIKQVLEELKRELPGLRRFATLSPMPRFADTIRSASRGERDDLTRAQLDALVADCEEELCEASGATAPLDGLLQLLDGDSWPDLPESATTALSRLALAYLCLPVSDARVVDPVASFHLANGARLERINVLADDTEDRRRASFGVMVSYVYEPDELERNHERFVTAGEIMLSRSLSRELRSLRALLDRPEPRRRRA